jgi:hypothetical protein
MKSSVRLLLFVALLLPFRGALAVSGWLCQTDLPSSASMTAHAHEHRTAPVADPSGDADHGGCHGGGEHGAQPHSGSSSCHLCSSVCGAPAVASTSAQFHGMPPPGAERFAAIAPPRVEFAFGGLERPPRTI